MTLTKADIVQEVYKNHNNLTKAEANAAVEAFLNLSKDTLIKGFDLLLSGFGKFNVRDKNPRRGRKRNMSHYLFLPAATARTRSFNRPPWLECQEK